MWYCDSSYVFGVVDNFKLYSFICASKSILFMDVENIQKNPAKSMRATLACLFTCLSQKSVFLESASTKYTLFL